MTAGLVLISYAQGADLPRIVWVGLWLDFGLLVLSLLAYTLR